MPAISLLPPEAWAEIEKAYIIGVSPSEIAGKYGVETNAIHQRAHRFQWPSPARIAKERAALAKSKAQTGPNPDYSNGNSGNVSEHKTALSMAVDTLLENGQKSNLIASRLSLQMLQKATESPDALKPLQDIGDVKTALSVARIAAGMDSEGGKVQVNLAMFQDGAVSQAADVTAGEMVWEAETSGETPQDG